MAVIRRRRAKAEFDWVIFCVIFVAGTAGTDDQMGDQAGWASL
jgi:hypothetical protein